MLGVIGSILLIIYFGGIFVAAYTAIDEDFWDMEFILQNIFSLVLFCVLWPVSVIVGLLARRR